jgi:hypothetical protein
VFLFQTVSNAMMKAIKASNYEKFKEVVNTLYNCNSFIDLRYFYKWFSSAIFWYPEINTSFTSYLVSSRKYTEFKLFFDFIKQSPEAPKLLDTNFFFTAFQYMDNKTLSEVVPSYFSGEMIIQNCRGNTCLHLLAENRYCSLVIL